MRAAWPGPGDGAGWVGGLQNGMAKDDVLAEVFGPERVVGAVTILGGERRPRVRSRSRASAARTSARSARHRPSRAPGHGRRHPAPGRRDPGGGAAGHPDRSLVEGLQRRRCVRCHVGAADQHPRLFRDPHLIRAYLGLVRETAAIAAAHGVPVGDYTNFPIGTYVTRADEVTVAALSQKAFLASAATGGIESFASMTQDLRAGRAIEVDDVFADLVERGERAGVAVPRLRLVRDFLRGLDPGHQAG